MADQPKSSNAKGVIFFLLFALPIIGVIVGAPFYVSLVQSPERKVDAAIEADVDAVCRAVFSLDAQLSAIKDMRAGEKSEPLDEAVVNKKDLHAKDVLASLQQTTAILRSAVDADLKNRNIKSKAATQFTSGPASAKGVYSELQSKQIAAHDRTLKDAESALRRLPSGSHLWANRVRAVFGLAQVQLHRNGGDFEGWQALSLQDAAEQLAAPLFSMRRNAAAISAQKPVEAIAATAKSLEENSAAQSTLASAIQQLSGDISANEAQAAKLQNSATAARAKMSELFASATIGVEGRQQYVELSNDARKAEVDAAAIFSGAIIGAKAVPTNDDDASPKYEGGSSAPGTRDKRLRLEELRDQAALLEARKATLSKEHQSLSEAADKLESQMGEVTKQVETLTQSVNELLSEADKHAENAKKRYDEAAKICATAAKSAKAAVGDAKKRTGDAKGAGQDERLQRVAGDNDMEASMHCLAAEIAFQMALVDAAKIEMLRDAAAAKGAVAAATGGEKVAAPEDEIDKLRTDASNQIAESLKSYELAANLLKNSNAKFADGSISGKNYVWQVQISQAAAHLLKAAILADKPEERNAEQEQANKFLTDAVKTREQSPLLAPAVETLLYLQQTTR